MFVAPIQTPLIEIERRSDTIDCHMLFWLRAYCCQRTALEVDPAVWRPLRDLARPIPGFTVQQLQNEFVTNLDQTFPRWSITGNILAVFENVPYAEIASADAMKAFAEKQARAPSVTRRISAPTLLSSSAERLLWSIHYSRLLSLDAGIGYREIGLSMKSIGDRWPALRLALIEAISLDLTIGGERVEFEPPEGEDRPEMRQTMREFVTKKLPETWSPEGIATLIDESLLSRAKLDPERVKLLFPGRTTVPSLIGVKDVARRSVQGARLNDQRAQGRDWAAKEEIELYGKAWAPVYRRLHSLLLLWFATTFEEVVITPPAATLGADSVRLHGRAQNRGTAGPPSTRQNVASAATPKLTSAGTTSERFAFCDTKTRTEKSKRSSKRGRVEDSAPLPAAGNGKELTASSTEFIRASGTSKGLLPLPYEIQREILSYLPARHLNCAVVCCRPWFHLVRGDAAMRASVQRSRVLKAAYNQFFEDDWGEKTQVLPPCHPGGFYDELLLAARRVPLVDRSPGFDDHTSLAFFSFGVCKLFPTADMSHLFKASAAASSAGHQVRQPPSLGQQQLDQKPPLPQIFNQFQLPPS